MRSLAALLTAAALIAGGAVASEKPLADLTVERGPVAVRSGDVTVAVNDRYALKNGDRVISGKNSIAKIRYRHDCRGVQTIKDGQIRVIRREVNCLVLIPGGVALAALVALTSENHPPVSP